MPCEQGAAWRERSEAQRIDIVKKALFATIHGFGEPSHPRRPRMGAGSRLQAFASPQVDTARLQWLEKLPTCCAHGVLAAVDCGGLAGVVRPCVRHFFLSLAVRAGHRMLKERLRGEASSEVPRRRA